MRIKTLVVEDEPHSREYLTDLLSKDEDLHLLKEAINGREGLKSILDQKPQLIFLDIQMPGINGVDLLKEISAHYNPTVIFTTAYDEFAVKAFELNAVDYLLKPFDARRLNKSLERAKKLIDQQMKVDLSDNISKLVKDYARLKQPYLNHFDIKEKGLITRIDCDDVRFFEASDVYVTIHLKHRSYLYRVSLNHLATQLDPQKFLRVHRSYIVNMDFVEMSSYLNNNTFKLVLDSGHELISSRSYKEELSKFVNS